jgi:DNA-directed RNA polymerase specialized sigma subunit
VKIALNLNQKDSYVPDGLEHEKAIERDVLACRRGDWEAKTRLTQAFLPLLTSLAKKRSQDTAAVNRYIEAGKEGIQAAVRHSKASSGTKFEIFALSFIENAMNRADRPGWLARLFGRR